MKKIALLLLVFLLSGCGTNPYKYNPDHGKMYWKDTPEGQYTKAHWTKQMDEWDKKVRSDDTVICTGITENNITVMKCD